MRLKIVHLGTVTPFVAPAPELAPNLEDAGVTFDPALDRTQIDATTDEFRLIVAPTSVGSVSRPPSFIRVSAYPPGSVAEGVIPDPAELPPIASAETAVGSYGRVTLTLPGLPPAAPYDALIVAAFED